jgi:hypothetical protein
MHKKRRCRPPYLAKNNLAQLAIGFIPLWGGLTKPANVAAALATVVGLSGVLWSWVNIAEVRIFTPRCKSGKTRWESSRIEGRSTPPSLGELKCTSRSYWGNIHSSRKNFPCFRERSVKVFAFLWPVQSLEW